MLAVSSGNEEARLWSLTLVEQSASAVHQATLTVFGKRAGAMVRAIRETAVVNLTILTVVEAV